MKTKTQSSALISFAGARRPRHILCFAWFTAIALSAVTAFTQTEEQTPPDDQGKKPNILVIMGDDIGWFNPSCYHSGIMGYQTPNIDRIAREGARFTDWYGQQSCTAGRAAFITGQSPIRTGLTKVGLPGADVGLQKEDPTVAEFLKQLGYATGQFGKNHLGDKDEHLCPPRTALTSSSATYTTSTPRRSPRTPTIQTTPTLRSASARAASSSPPPMARSRTPVR
jgi:arylsulfatase A-like enzyme